MLLFSSTVYALPNKLTYNQKEQDNTGLFYYGARYYDADIGRFITADTVKGDITDPLSLNRYSYVKNNPMKYIDPSGNQEANILITDMGDWSLGDEYLHILGFNTGIKTRTGNKVLAKTIGQSVKYLKEAYSTEGYNPNVVVGYQSSEEARSMLEEEIGINSLSRKETVQKAGDFLRYLLDIVVDWMILLTLV
jgi:RHS repeat-associated protein